MSDIRYFYAALATFVLNIRPRSFIFHLVGMNGKSLLQPTASFTDHGHTCPNCRRRMVVGPNGALSHWHSLSAGTLTNVIPQHFKVGLLPVLMKGWDRLQRVEITGVLKLLLVDLRRELSEKGIELAGALAGDGWEEI